MPVNMRKELNQMCRMFDSARARHARLQAENAAFLSQRITAPLMRVEEISIEEARRLCPGAFKPRVC